MTRQFVVAALILAGASGAVDGQEQRRTWRSAFAPLTLIGSPAEERLRLDQLRGVGASSDWLVRTPSRLSDTSTGWRAPVGPLCDARVALVPGHATSTWNSALPFERNDAGAWAGRGLTLAASGGAVVACGAVTVVVAPEIWYTENRAFHVVPNRFFRRSDFANPFHSTDQSSADLPIRFGTRPVSALQPGQSSVTVRLGRISAGVSSESEWWGPGIRNALLLSNNAEGIPRWFVGTAQPLPTRAGLITARLITGTLTESRFFDRIEIGVARPLSGVIGTIAVAGDTNLTLGAARVVYRRRARSTIAPVHALDALTVWSTRSPGDSAEQLTSFMGRWVFPGSGAEVYGEWARTVLPTSVRDLLVAPQHSQGYTVGMQWLGPADAGQRAWRVQLELTNLEQLRVVRELSPPSFYTSPVVPHGYTQRGQVIGATIGPGSSSQFAAVDRVGRRWSGGLFAGRIRWDHDEFYPRPTGLSFYAHDVSLYGGVRGIMRDRVFEYAMELVRETRMNYLFQHAQFGFGNDRTFDVNNVSLRLQLTPAPRTRTRR